MFDWFKKRGDAEAEARPLTDDPEQPVEDPEPEGPEPGEPEPDAPDAKTPEPEAPVAKDPAPPREESPMQSKPEQPDARPRARPGPSITSLGVTGMLKGFTTGAPPKPEAPPSPERTDSPSPEPRPLDRTDTPASQKESLWREERPSTSRLSSRDLIRDAARSLRLDEDERRG